jgi:apolipoprotein N-acyltransferase
MERTPGRLLKGQEDRLRLLLLCTLSGFLYSIVSPRLHLHPLIWVLLVPFLEALHDQGPRRGFHVGWGCGTLIHLLSFHWVIGTIQRYSNLNLSLSILAWILFALYSGLAFGVMASVSSAVHQALRVPWLIILPLAYTAMEFLYPFIFRWHVGAGLYEVLPFIQISDLFGVYGVTALVVLVNVTLWEVYGFLRKRRPFPRLPVAAASVALILTVLYGFWRIHAIDDQRAQAERFGVGVVQANIRIEEKQSPPLVSDIWRRYQRLSAEVVPQGADLIVWPESSVPFAYKPEGNSNSLSGALRQLVQSLGSPLLFGSWSMGKEAPRNTAYLLSPEGQVEGQYDKVRLLAFGEYLPFANLYPPVKDWIQGVGDFEPGERLEPLCTRGVCFGVLICYEAILDDLSRKYVNRGARFLVNITNDVWFGDTDCPEQHLMLASFRAVENRVWLVRAANTGISVFVDPAGRVLMRTPVFQQAERYSTIELLSVPCLYRDWGTWFPTLCSVAVLGLLLLSLPWRHLPWRRFRQRSET